METWIINSISRELSSVWKLTKYSCLGIYWKFLSLSTDALYINFIYFFVAHALRTSSKLLYPRQARIRFAKTQLLELYIWKILIKYRIYPKFGLKMQLFWFFYINTERYLLGKRTGVLRSTQSGGQSPANILNLKKLFWQNIIV